MIKESKKHTIELTVDPTYAPNSSDNVNNYDHVHFKPSEFRLSTMIGLKVFEDDVLVNSAIIGSDGGATGIHEHSQIIEKDRIVVCCSDTVFCLSIPELKLIWRTQVDQATCFGVFKYNDTYIVHGELEISRIGRNGEVLWQQSGADIFVTQSSTNGFEITKEYIKATDWENRVYKFDFDGNVIKEEN